MTLREAKCLFTEFQAKLVLKAKELGFETAIDSAKVLSAEQLIFKAKELGLDLPMDIAIKLTGHKHNSLHNDGLAIDFNLYRNGRWLTKTEDHKLLGLFWETLHPACYWGGHFGDGNHYSFRIDDRK